MWMIRSYRVSILHESFTFNTRGSENNIDLDTLFSLTVAIMIIPLLKVDLTKMIIYSQVDTRKQYSLSTCFVVFKKPQM